MIRSLLAFLHFISFIKPYSQSILLIQFIESKSFLLSHLQKEPGPGMSLAFKSSTYLFVQKAYLQIATVIRRGIFYFRRRVFHFGYFCARQWADRGLSMSFEIAYWFSASLVCGGKCSLIINVEFLNLFTVKLAQICTKIGQSYQREINFCV